ncbi:hypothetical protein G159_00715 [Planococcus glaciei CHR43]|uniref:hypothetical protein n=1 Tax=Planococcus glaciei TaxID=459472 RepID=UPI0003DF07B2|nr:hypothetical protein [Planococcus glaciei]ETP70664.1 hypothetical protein G159_00715 [Planococcus glaciei CHR43]
MTDWRSGAFCRTAEWAYDPRIWSLQLDKQKSESACPASTIRKLIGEAALFGA